MKQHVIKHIITISSMRMQLFMSCTETWESAIICHTPRDRQLHCSLVHLSGNKNRTQTSYPDVGTAPISGHIRKIESELLCKYFHLNFDAQIKDTCSLSTSTTGTSVSFLHKRFNAYMGDWWMSETVLFTQSKSAGQNWYSNQQRQNVQRYMCTITRVVH